MAWILTIFSLAWVGGVLLRAGVSRSVLDPRPYEKELDDYRNMSDLS